MFKPTTPFVFAGHAARYATGALLTILTLFASASDLPQYTPPPNEDLSPARVLSGATRGTSDESIQIAVIAPDHTGLTARSQPDLVWSVSGKVDAQVLVTVQDANAVEPLLEIKRQATLKPGFVRVPMTGTQAKLKPGVEYEWSVSLKSDTGTIHTSGVIKRIEPDEQLTKRLSSAKPQQRIHVHAKNSLWYDAITEATQPDTTQSASQSAARNALLKQVGLSNVISWADKQPTPTTFTRTK